MTIQKADDLEAVRVVVEAIKDFKPEEQQRIFRWVAEKLSLPQPFLHPFPSQNAPSMTSGPAQAAHPQVSAPHPAKVTDIKTFILAKKPRNDVQFAAAVAYYYRFEAPYADRKEAINKEDLQDATRRVGRERFANPFKTLSNAHQLGLLDKGAEKATFVINSVGENLVAMTLPDGSASGKPSKKRKAARPAVKKAPLRKAKRS